jgi:hypothetical protein
MCRFSDPAFGYAKRRWRFYFPDEDSCRCYVLSAVRGVFSDDRMFIGTLRQFLFFLISRQVMLRSATREKFVDFSCGNGLQFMILTFLNRNVVVWYFGNISY